MFYFFFFKQKTAYEIYQCDWSSTCALPISFAIKGSWGQWLTDLWSEGSGYEWNTVPRNGTVRCCLPEVPLNSGSYNYSIAGRINGEIEDFILDAGTFNIEQGDFFGTGKLPSRQHGDFLFRQEWSLDESNQNDMPKHTERSLR